jgi:hypothetical protein
MRPRAYPKHAIPPRLRLGVCATTRHSGKRTQAAHPCCTPRIDRGDDVGVTAARSSRVVSGASVRGTRPAPPGEAERPGDHRACLRAGPRDVQGSDAPVPAAASRRAGAPGHRGPSQGQAGPPMHRWGRKPRPAISTRVGPRPWDPVTHHVEGAVANKLWVSDPPTGRSRASGKPQGVHGSARRLGLGPMQHRLAVTPPRALSVPDPHRRGDTGSPAKPSAIEWILPGSPALRTGNAARGCAGMMDSRGPVRSSDITARWILSAIRLGSSSLNTGSSHA